ncbi:YfhO family protein [Lactiplantibacillus daowaiensis]|uniref:YfhO family protein n=1 Tax=Lactiplantibacillus daowaiensis TaxID=2559918 RepID=A0ABW1S0M0_9LACO|nr:YfhO family protein [Lactiplantibacillus daowaiensis]
MIKLRKIPLWVLYTGMFSLIVVITFSGLFLAGRTLIWEVDGIAQHFPILVEFQKILQHPAQQGLFSWSWNLGLGADQLTTFAYYVVGDPFNYLVAFMPTSKLEFGYQFLIILRLYTVGLAFLGFSRQFHFSQLSRLIGTLTYTFTAYTFYVGMHHPFFLLPMIWFPLLCWTIERILHGRSWWPLTLVTAIVIMSNFYFAYLLALGSLLYAVVRYWHLRADKRLTLKFRQLLGRLVAAVSIGVGMAGVILVPTLLAMLHATRTSFDFANGLWTYPINYYVNLPNRLLTNGGGVQYWVTLGLSGISFLGLIYTLRHFKRYFYLNVVILGMALGILVPAFAAVFNVFSSPSNRWLLMATLVFAYVTMIMVDQLPTLTVNDLKWLATVSLGLIAWIWVVNGFYMNIRKHDIATYLVILALVIFVLLQRILHLKRWQFVGILMGLVTLNLLTNGLGWTSINTTSGSTEQIRRGTALTWVKHYLDDAQKGLPKTGFYRTNLTPNYYTLRSAGNNIPMVLGTHTVTSYYSVQSGSVGQLSQSVGNLEYAMNAPLGTLNERTTLSNLLGVKYIFARADQLKNQALPAGYTPVKSANGTTKVYADKFVYGLSNHTGTVLLQSKNALPLAYTQSQQFSATAYQKLSPVNREQALLQGALTTTKMAGVKTIQPTGVSESVAYSAKADDQQVLDTLDKVMIYRLKNATGSSNGATGLAANATTLTTKQRQAIAPETGLTKPTKAVQRLIQQNQTIVTRTNQVNQTGLTSLTSDAQGNPIPYQLTLKHPERYRHTELYLTLSGLKYERTSISQMMSVGGNNSIFNARPNTTVDQLNRWRNGLKDSLSASGYTLTAQTVDNSVDFDQLGTTNMSDYEQRHTAVFNLGYSDRLRKTIDLSFTSGIQGLQFKRAKLVAVRFGQAYNQQTKQLQQQGLQQLKVTNNQVTGTTNNAQASVLTTSIPYSTGWQLQVDGKNVATQVVNDGFVGAKLIAGKHQIKLVYRTPGLLIGWLLTGLSMVILMAYIGWRWWQRIRSRTLS